jgi:GNAT superfamily N-acetyltransferase
MNTSIRRGTQQDVAEIMAIVRAVVPLMHAQDNYQWGDKNRDGIFYPNDEAFEGDATDGTLWVVEGSMAEGGPTCVLAAAALTVDQPEEYGGAGLDLSVPAVVPHRMAVHPAMHGRGLARQLFEKAEGLAPRRDRRSELDAGACGLAFGLGGLGFDAKACRQIGFTQTEGLVEEAARLARQLRTPLGGCQLRARGINTHARRFPFCCETFAFQGQLGLDLS